MAGIVTPPQMDGKSRLPLVSSDDSSTQARAAALAGWRTTMMIEYSGGGAPVRELSENHWEDIHFFHSMNRNDSYGLCGEFRGAFSCSAAFYWPSLSQSLSL